MMNRRTFCRSFFLLLFCIYIGGAVYFYVLTDEHVENARYDAFDPEVVDMIERKRKIHDVQIEYDEKFERALHVNGFQEDRNKQNGKEGEKLNKVTENKREKFDRNVAIRLGVTKIIEKVNILKEQLNLRNLTVFRYHLHKRNPDIVKHVTEKGNITSKEKENLPSGNKFGRLNKGVRLFRKNTRMVEPKNRNKSRNKELKPVTQFLPKIKSIDDSETRQYQSRKQIHFNKFQVNFEEILPQIFLYSAFLDTRDTIAKVRLVIVTMSNSRIPSSVWCHFSASGNTDEILSSEVSFYETCENHSKDYAAYIASCKIPRHDVNGSSVWISDKPGPPNTKETPPIRVIYNRPSNNASGKYAVCIPPLFGKVNVVRLAEFIEFSRILGAEHFTFYNNSVEGDIKQVLEYYELLNIATTLPWSLPIANEKIWYHGQSAAVWDCLYRNMYLYKQVAFLDFDEFIIPQNQSTWDELFTFIRKQDKADDTVVSAYRFLSAFFDPEFHGKVHDLSFEESQLVNINVTMRTSFFSSIRTKLLVDPTKIFELGIHHVSKPFKEDYKVVTIDTEHAFIHHHRKCDPNWGMNCGVTKMDTSAWKYRDQLVNFTRWRLQRVQKYIDSKSSKEK